MINNQNNEWEVMWKEAGVTQFEVSLLSRRLSGETEKNGEKPQRS
jgi:hypothetical protein